MNALRQTSGAIEGGGRGWILGGLGGAVLLVVAVWFLVVSPARGDTADLELSTADVNSQNTVLAARVAELKELASQRSTIADQLKEALDGLPPGTQLPVFSRQLTDHAATRGVTLTGFSVGASVDAATLSAAGAAAAQPAAEASVLAIPVTVTSTGSALDQLYFLRDLQQTGPRLALVTATSLTPGQDSTSGSIADTSTLTVQLTVFTRRLPTAVRDQITELRSSETSN